MNWNKFPSHLANNLLAGGGAPSRRVLLRLRGGVLLAFMGLVVFLAYSNTLEVPFILDDEPHIELNPSIRLDHFTWNNLLAAGFESVNPHRPVANLSFALNYYFHQYKVTGFHVVNILIHVLTGILLYLFISTTIRLPLLQGRYGAGRWLPFAAALIWLVHPIQTQAVTYIVQRMTTLAAMFYLLAMLCYINGRLAEKRWQRNVLFAVGLLAGLLALGSKEMAATLPFAVLLYEWYFFQDLSRTWLKRNFFYLLGAIVFLAGLAFLYLGQQPLAAILNGYQGRDFSLAQRLLTEPRVVMFYVSLLLFPHPSRLNLEHDFGLSGTFLSPPETFLAIAAIAGALGLAGILARQQRLLSFCILWFLGNMVIESSVIGLEIVFEHRNYLPSMLFILFVVIIAGRCLKGKKMQAAVLTLVLVFLSVWTHERNEVWGDEVRLWSDCAEKSPHKARPHLNLGTAMFEQGRTTEAIISYSEVLRIDPQHAIAHNNLGFVMAGLKRFKVAIAHYSEALRIRPNYEKAHFNLSVALSRTPVVMKDIPSAAAADFADSYFERGIVLADMGSPEAALVNFSEVLRRNPGHAEAHFQMGTILAEQGRLDEAIDHFTATLRIKPDDADAHFNLGNAFAGKDRFAEAISHFSEALRLQPEDMAARRNLNILRRVVEARDLSRHASSYAGALRVKPNYEGTHFELDVAAAER